LRTLTEPNRLTAYLADDVRWTVHGNAKFCDTYKGKEDVVQRLFGELAPLLETIGPFEIGNVIREGDHVVVQAVGTGRTTKTGRPYNNDYCLVVKLANERSPNSTSTDTELITSAFGSK
jgi:ketosteroid isomerase-like protein